jgi:hypothetical protein
MNDTSYTKWIVLGYLAESFIYIRDWNREAMAVMFYNIIKQRGKERNTLAMGQKQSN